MERIDFKKQNIPFTQVANGVIYDKKLSLGAKTIYAYMYSKPDGWDFASSRIAKELSVNKKTVLRHLAELKDCGYLISLKLPSGRMLYKVIFPPFGIDTEEIEPESEKGSLAINPESKKATVQKSHSAENGPISNTISKVIKSISNTSNSNELQVSKEVPLVIEAFVKVNKACVDFYGNTTQRKYAEKLLVTYGQDMVMKVVAMLPQFNAKFYNKATTPKELWDKWAKIEAEGQAMKNGQGNRYQAVKIF